MYRHKGFTLIELITVIAILGALAVIALPRFINLQDDAQRAAVDGVAGSLSAGAAVNLAGALADSDGDFTTVTACSDVPRTLADEALPSGYSITTGGAGFSTTALGDTGECVVTGPDGNFSATFTGYAVP